MEERKAEGMERGKVAIEDEGEEGRGNGEVGGSYRGLRGGRRTREGGGSYRG